MAIGQIEKHLYMCDRCTPLKELAEAGWISSVKLSRMEDLWAVRCLKWDIDGATAAGIDILIKDDGPGRKYYYKKGQIVFALKQLQGYLKERGEHDSYEYPVTWVRDFWRQY